MVTYDTLRIAQDDLLLFVRLSRPGALNALNARMFDELEHFFTEGHQAYTFSSIILTGEGEKAFAAGTDIKELSVLNGEQAHQLSAKGQRIFRLIEMFHKPVIAAVNGFALGGGCELAMVCHVRIAAEHARFGQPEVNLGIIPGYGGTQRLIQLAGKGKALELLLTGEMISAQEAHRIGLVNQVVPAGELLTASRNLALKMASRGPLALRGVIRCADAYFQPGIDGFAFEAKVFGETADSADFKEGTGAFIEKRKPQFSGR